MVHEHSALGHALDCMLSYDQLNIANLASAESLSRRPMLLEEAYHGRASAPSYEGSDYYLGRRDARDGSVVDPSLRKFVASRLKDEAEIKKEQRKYKEEREAKPSRPGGGGGGAGGAKGAARKGGADGGGAGAGGPNAGGGG